MINKCRSQLPWDYWVDTCHIYSGSWGGGKAVKCGRAGIVVHHQSNYRVQDIPEWIGVADVCSGVLGVKVADIWTEVLVQVAAAKAGRAEVLEDGKPEAPVETKAILETPIPDPWGRLRSTSVNSLYFQATVMCQAWQGESALAPFNNCLAFP